MVGFVLGDQLTLARSAAASSMWRTRHLAVRSCPTADAPGVRPARPPPHVTRRGLLVEQDALAVLIALLIVARGYDQRQRSRSGRLLVVLCVMGLHAPGVDHRGQFVSLGCALTSWPIELEAPAASSARKCSPRRAAVRAGRSYRHWTEAFFGWFWLRGHGRTPTAVRLHGGVDLVEVVAHEPPIEPVGGQAPVVGHVPHGAGGDAEVVGDERLGDPAAFGRLAARGLGAWDGPWLLRVRGNDTRTGEAF